MEEHGLKIPLLIGGATTSKMHTAVKIAPQVWRLRGCSRAAAGLSATMWHPPYLSCTEILLSTTLPPSLFYRDPALYYMPFLC